MAGSTQYDVIVAFQTQGNLENAIGGATTKVGGLQRATEGAQGAIKAFGAAALSTFTGVVESAGSVVMTLGKIGAGSVFAGAVYGVQGLNAQLEISKNSVAAVLNAQGVSATMPEARARAHGLVKQMQIDARDLPGEFSDLFGIFQTGIGSALQAGLTDDTFRQLSAKTMAAAKALDVPMDQAGRELSKLLMGSAGMDNTLGMRLGFDAEKTYKDLDKVDKKFKDLSAEGRSGLITEALGKFGPSIEAFGKTFDAQWSTLLDNGKQFIGLATTPLFEEAKVTLAEINQWLTDNQERVKDFANTLGRGLVEAFRRGIALALEWGPIIYDFAVKTMDRLERGWRVVEPYFTKAAGVFAGMLKDADGTLDKVEKVLGLYAGLKLAGGANEVVAFFAGGGGGPGPGGGAGGALGSIKGTVGAGLIGGAAGYGIGHLIGGEVAGDKASDKDREVAQGIFSKIFGGMGAGAAAGWDAAGARGALVGGVVGGAAGLYGANAEISQNERAASVAIYAREVDAMALMSGEFNAATGQFVENTGRINMASFDFQFRMMEITARLGEAEAELFSYAAAVRNAAADFKEKADQEGLAIGTDALKSLTAATTAATKAADLTKPETKADAKKKPTTNHGTIINGNVYLTVTSAAEPGQIARLSLAELSKLRRTPGSSPLVRNYSAR